MYEYDESWARADECGMSFARSDELSPRGRDAVQLFIHLSTLISPFHSTLSNKHAQ